MDKIPKFIVVCSVNCESTACTTLKEAREIRYRYDDKFPFVPNGIDNPAMIYPIDKYLGCLMRDHDMTPPKNIELPENIEDENVL